MKTIKKGTKVLITWNMWAYDCLKDTDKMLYFRKGLVGTVIGRDVASEKLRDSCAEDFPHSKKELHDKCYRIRFNKPNRETYLYESEFKIIKENPKRYTLE